jgi:V8-like Glu-specific endopeptidase
VVRRSRLHRLRAAARRVLGAAACVAGLLVAGGHPGAQQGEPTVAVAVPKPKEIQAVADRQRRMLLDEEPQLARRFGKGTPQYLAALQARLEAHAKSALKPASAPPAPAGRSPTTRSISALPDELEPPVLFPIHRDPRTAQALEQQRLEMERSRPKFRMYGGAPTVDDTGRDRFPYTVALRSGGRICSGVLVGRRAVMTAQHCVCRLNLGAGSEVHFALSIGTGTVARVTQVASYARHGCPADPDLGHDVALVFLDTPTAPVAPAEVGNTLRVKTGTALWVVGFGEQEDRDTGQKLTAQIRVVSRNCGAPGDPSTYGCESGREAVLLDTEFVHDSCYGDSGGPAFIDDPAAGLRLVAIVSRGVATSTLSGARCGQGGIYTLIIREVIEWMNGAIRQHG